MAKENQYKSASKKNDGHIADLKKTNQKKNLASYEGNRGKWYPNNWDWNNMRIV